MSKTYRASLKKPFTSLQQARPRSGADRHSDRYSKTKVRVFLPESVDIRGYKPSVKVIPCKSTGYRVVAAAKRPLLSAGGGVFSAHAQQVLRKLVEITKIPMVTSMMGLGVLPTAHPNNLGMIGAFGTPTANYALAKADLLMVVGARIGDRAIPAPTEVGKRAKIIHIDVDPAEIGKVMPPSIPLVGDVRVVLEQLVADLGPAGTDEWRMRAQVTAANMNWRHRLKTVVAR
jgi:acetolactate synthase-1/2/3 large subunit